MPRFRCSICQEVARADSPPALCEHCGSTGITWESVNDGRIEGMVTITASGMAYIVEGNKQIGREIIRRFFLDLRDEDGDPVYKYCDPSLPMLEFVIGPDGQVSIAAPSATKNYFLLNGKRLDHVPVVLKQKSVLELLGSAKGRSVATFSLE